MQQKEDYPITDLSAEHIERFATAGELRILNSKVDRLIIAVQNLTIQKAELEACLKWMNRNANHYLKEQKKKWKKRFGGRGFGQYGFAKGKVK